MDINFQQLMAEAGEGFQPIPPGPYTVECEKAEPTTSKASGAPQIRVTLRVLGGDHNGRKLFDQFTLTAGNPVALGFFFDNMASFGLGRDFFASNPQMAYVAQMLLGRQCNVAVGIEPYQGVERNKIKQFRPIAGGQAPAQVAPAQGVPGFAPQGAMPIAPAPQFAPQQQPQFQQPAPQGFSPQQPFAPQQPQPPVAPQPPQMPQQIPQPQVPPVQEQAPWQQQAAAYPQQLPEQQYQPAPQQQYQQPQPPAPVVQPTPPQQAYSPVAPGEQQAQPQAAQMWQPSGPPPGYIDPNQPQQAPPAQSTPPQYQQPPQQPQGVPPMPGVPGRSI